MSQYRLHIDIPLGGNEEEAIYKANLLVQEFFKLNQSTAGNLIRDKYEIEKASYRLGHDEDRQKSNYLDKNENGHVSNKKTTIDLISH